MSFREKLKDLADAMRDASKEAREGLRNANLADVLDLGAARLQQALEHPDVDRVGQEDPNAPAGAAPLQSGGNAMFAATDPGAAAANEEARRRAEFETAEQMRREVEEAKARKAAEEQAEKDKAAASFAPFPGTENAAGGSKPPGADNDAKAPGDPSFEQKHDAAFTDPKQAELNKDGTLRTAPLAPGVDNRDK